MLSGTLDDFALADVFRLISLAHKTGVLEIARQAGRGEVYFRRGEVYYAKSSLVLDPIGQKLVRSGALTEGQLRRALDEHAATGERLGAILAASGAASATEVENAVRGQTEEAVFDLLRWERGEFTWEPDRAADAEIPIAVSVENLIMEAARRLDELDVIARKIPSADAVMVMAATPPEGAAEINITPDEWRLLVLVDGTRSVADVARAIGTDDFSAMRTLYGLASAGLVEVASPTPRARPQTTPASGPTRGRMERFTITTASEDLQTASEPAVDPFVAAPAAGTPRLEPGVSGMDVEEAGAAAVDEEEPAMERPPRDQIAAADGGRSAGEATPGDDAGVAEVAEADSPPAGWFEEPEAPGSATTDADADVAATASAGGHGPGSATESEHTAPLESTGDETSESSERPPAREFAGLFGAPAPSARTSPPQPERTPTPAGDQVGDRPRPRKRVEDDDAVTKGLISRLIDGVKGL